MKHLSDAELGALVDGALAGEPRAAAERHVAECASCREALAALEAQDRDLARALAHDPGDEYFDTFAARVQERIRGARATRSRATPVKPATPAGESGSIIESLGRWLSGPRLAWAGAAAALVVGAGVAFLVSRETPVQALRDNDFAARSDQVASERKAAPSATSATGDARSTGPSRDDASSMSAAPPPSAAQAPAMEPRAIAREPAAREAPQAAPESKPEESTSGSPTPAPFAGNAGTGSAPSPASPQRSRRVRREGGEDVPVPTPADALIERAKQAQGLAAPPPSAGTRLNRIKEAQRSLANEPLSAEKTTMALEQGTAWRDSIAGKPLAQGGLGARALDRDAAGNTRACGIVRDTRGRPIAGAQVAFADLGIVTTTDASGHWCMDAPRGERTLTVMAVGFRDARRAVTIGDGSADEDLTLAAVPVLGAGGEGSGFARLVEPAPSWPSTVRAMAVAAERASVDAERRHTAAAHDSAARLWERVAGGTRRGPAAVAARRGLAEARYQAWQLEPSPARAAAAMAALTSYVAVAPDSLERTRARERLDHLRRKP